MKASAIKIKKTFKKWKTYRYAQATKSFSPLWFTMRTVSLLLMLVMLWSTINQIKTLLYVCTLPQRVIQLQNMKRQMLWGPLKSQSVYTVLVALGPLLSHSIPVIHNLGVHSCLNEGKHPSSPKFLELLTRTDWAILAQKASVSIISSVQLGCIEHGSKEQR